MARHKQGPVAQLGERHNGIVEVKGSNPFGSTNFMFEAINQGGTTEDLFVPECFGELKTKGIFYFVRF